MPLQFIDIRLKGSGKLPFTIEQNTVFDKLLDDAFAKMNNLGEATIHFGSAGCVIRRIDMYAPYSANEITFVGDAEVHFFHQLAGNHGFVANVKPTERLREFYILIFGTGSFLYDGRVAGRVRSTYKPAVLSTRRSARLNLPTPTL